MGFIQQRRLIIKFHSPGEGLGDGMGAGEGDGTGAGAGPRRNQSLLCFKHECTMTGRKKD